MLDESVCNLVGAAFLFPLGLALGSFFELATDRLPRGESILWPPSHCRTCNHRLTTSELIPVLSFVLQGGRCSSCRSPIGSGIPIREALSGAALSLPWLLVGCRLSAAALAGGAFLLFVGWVGWAISVARRRYV